MDTPRISIITVCFNEKKIEATCQSIVCQNWRDFEWIVVDGGSTDGTVDILNKYRDHMSVFISEKDSGIYNAMNKGISHAQGEYLIFMNGGDYFLDPYALERVFAHNTWKEDIIYCDALFLKKDGSTLLREFKDSQTDLSEFLAYSSFAHQATFIRRNLFEQYGGYNEKHKIVSDWEKWIEFIVVHHATCKHCNRIVAIHNYNGISSQFTKEHLDERANVLTQYYPGKFNSDGTPISTCDQTILGKHYLTLCRVKLFGVIPLIKVKGTPDRHKSKIYLFNFLPIIKIIKQQIK